MWRLCGIVSRKSSLRLTRGCLKDVPVTVSRNRKGDFGAWIDWGSAGQAGIFLCCRTDFSCVSAAWVTRCGHHPQYLCFPRVSFPTHRLMNLSFRCFFSNYQFPCTWTLADTWTIPTVPGNFLFWTCLELVHFSSTELPSTPPPDGLQSLSQESVAHAVLSNQSSTIRVDWHRLPDFKDTSVAFHGYWDEQTNSYPGFQTYCKPPSSRGGCFTAFFQSHFVLLPPAKLYAQAAPSSW